MRWLYYCRKKQASIVVTSLLFATMFFMYLQLAVSIWESKGQHLLLAKKQLIGQIMVHHLQKHQQEWQDDTIIHYNTGQIKIKRVAQQVTLYITLTDGYQMVYEIALPATEKTHDKKQ